VGIEKISIFHTTLYNTALEVSYLVIEFAGNKMQVRLIKLQKDLMWWNLPILLQLLLKRIHLWEKYFLALGNGNFTHFASSQVYLKQGVTRKCRLS
jgi:hypothetical protein